MGKVAVHGAVEFQSFPCAALFGKHVKDCSLSRNRIIISSKKSIDSTGRSHGLCGYLRSDYSILYIPVVFSASNTNTFEDIPLQNRTVGDVPYCYFKYIDTRKGCKFTFWTLYVCVHVPGYPHVHPYECCISEKILNDLFWLCSFLSILSCLYKLKVRKQLIQYLVSL